MLIGRSPTTWRFGVLDGFDVGLRQRWGCYRPLGDVSAEPVAEPAAVNACTKYRVARRPLTGLVSKLMAPLAETDPADAGGAPMNTLQRLTPAA